ncbi:MAG TPA: hypothetical protein VJ720_04195, partial [Chitinophaga sp.]|nr:hypothetical protein [Chitinophaga sp.]
DFYAYTTVNNERVGTDGRTLIETSVKELRPDEIAAEINALLTGSQREQLAITGLYQHRNINDIQGLNKLVDDHYRKTDDYYQKLLDNENLDLSLQAGDAQKVAAIKERIAQVEKKRAEVTVAKKTLKEGGASNPEALKSSLYYEDWINGISGMLGYSQTSTRIVDNPGYKAMLDEFKIWADLQKDQSGSGKKGRSGSKKGSGSDDDDDQQDGWSAVTATVLPLSEEDRSHITLKDFSGRLAAIGSQMDQSMLQLLYRRFGESYVTRTVKDLDGDGITEDVYSLIKGKEQDARLAQASWWDAYRKGDPGLDITVRETLRENDEKRLVATKLAKVVADVEKRATAFLQSSSKFQQQKAAEKEFNKVVPVSIYGATVGPAQFKAYMDMRRDIAQYSKPLGPGLPGTVMVPEPDQATLDKYGITPHTYRSLKKAASSGNSQESEQFKHLLQLYEKTQERSLSTDKEKNAFITDEIKKYAGIFNEVALTLPSAKPEQLRPISNFVATLAANARETEMGGTTKWKIVRQMIGEEHAKGTAYSYVQDRDGNVRIRLSNPDVDKGTPQEIVVDSQTARINHFSVPDFLSATRSMLELGENIRTGLSFEESIPTNNQLTGKYQVRHEVENFNGRFKVKLYVSEPGAADTKPREIPINTVLFSDWTQLTNFLQQDVNEKFISSLLGNERTSAPVSPGSPFQNSFFSTNPLIR